MKRDLKRGLCLGFILFISSFKVLSTEGKVLPAQEGTNPPFKLEEATIQSIHQAIQARQLTCEKITHEYLNRIKEYNFTIDQEKPPLNAVVEINLNALEYARNLDHYFSTTGKLIGELHCIPVVLKDNIDTFDMTTTAGSFALLGSQPVKDAFIVEKLRKAGAIMLAKAAMDELSSDINGISSRSGRIGNAYDTTQNSGGSSGGSAVMVSANFALSGIGTDNSGSVRIPAAFNGIVGLRPSTGLISQGGVFPIGNLDATIGPMARTVSDLAAILEVMAKPDPLDEKTHPVPRSQTYMNALRPNGLKNKRIGIVRHVGSADVFNNMPTDVKKLIEESIKDMKGLGAHFVQEVDLTLFESSRLYNQAGQIEEVNDYLASFPATRRDFKDICESDRTRFLGDVKQCMQYITLLPNKKSQKYISVLDNFKKNRRYLEELMDHYKLDALLLPISSNGSANYHADTVNTWLNPVASNAGLPSITFNVGYRPETKMPVGIELIARQFAENVLIEMAYAYERHAPKRTPPILVSDKSFLNLPIAEINNLITVLGKNAYEKVLKQGPSLELSPEAFKLIFEETIKERSRPSKDNG